MKKTDKKKAHYTHAIYAVLCIWLLYAPVFSQTLPFKNFLKEDGLPHTFLTSIYQDSQGYIWFGTLKGLSRFDGKRFENFSQKDGLTDSRIHCITEDHNGTIWVGTRTGGVNCFRDGKFTHYSTLNGLPDNSIKSICEDGAGIMWFATGKGLSRFDGKKFKTYSTRDGLGSRSINDISIDKKGRMWVATGKGAGYLYRQDQKDCFTMYYTSDGLLHNRVLRLFHDSRGRTWLGTEKGLNCFQNGKFTSYTSQNGLISDYIHAISEDRSGNLWIGTLYGLSILSNGHFTNYTTNNGLPYNFIHSILQDHEGNIWIATNGGAARLRTRNIQNYSQKDGLVNNLVKYIIEDRKGRYWIATGNGLSRQWKGEFKNYTVEDGLIAKSINSLMEDRDGKIWIVTAAGLGILNPDTDKFTNYTVNEGLPTNIIIRLIQDRNGTIWIAHRKGVTCFKKGKFIAPPFHTPHMVTRLIEDRGGNIWLATNNGLFRHAPKTGSFTGFTTRNGLPSDVVYSLFEDSKGKIWIGTNQGLTCYVDGRFTTYNTEGLVPSDSPAEHQVNWGNKQPVSDSQSNQKKNKVPSLPQNLPQKTPLPGKTKSSSTSKTKHECAIQGTTPGLPDNTCYFIMEDRCGHIWIGTADGLTCFDGKAFKTYTFRKHGLVTDMWYTGFTDSKGFIMLGSAYGLTRFSPPPVRPNTIPPPIYINQVKVLEEAVPLSSVGHLPYDRNHLRIGFTGLCFSAPESVVYKYRMTGIDKDWKTTTDRALFYPYLPGKYHFQVIAINNDGIESLKPAELSFEIRPPYWKTLWFQTLMALIVLSGLMGFMFWRFKRTKEKLLLRARTRQLVMSQRMELMGTLAASAVHDLKNLLSIIIGYTEMVAETFNPEDETYEYNENIKSTADTAVQVVKQILSLARQKDEDSAAVNLTESLNDILEILRVTTPPLISFNWIPPQEAFVLYINPTRFHQLIMNLCINAVHAMPDGGALSIVLAGTEDNGISIKITDTGTGMEPETVEKIFDPLFTTKAEDKGTGLGLFVVKQIVDDYKGKIEVQSQPGKGTTFFITFYPKELFTEED